MLPTIRFGRRASILGLVTLALITSAVGAASVNAERVDDDRLKAAFVYKFTLLVDWPDTAFRSPDAPLDVCLLGADSLVENLESAVQGRVSHGRALTVKRIPDPARAPGCHVLFLGSGQAALLDQVLRSVSRAPTLTVGDSERFATRGGIIELRRDGSRVTFEINRESARRAGLDISSKLLQLAQSVHD